MTMPTGDQHRAGPPAFNFLLGQDASSQLGGSVGAPLPKGRRSSRPRRDKRSRARVDTRSLTIPIATGALVIALLGGSAFAGWAMVQASEADVRASSAAFCANLAETPGVLQQPGFGWPTDGVDLASTLDLMNQYQIRWAAIAAIAPQTVKPDATAIADSAAVLTASIETSKTIDRPATLATMQGITASTDIAAWAAKYCN